MSHQSLNAKCSQCQSVQNFPNLAALSHELQEAAANLSTFCAILNEKQLSANCNVGTTKLASSGALTACNYPTAPTNNEGETRCYYFSPATLRYEQKLLEKYRAEDLHALLAEAYLQLSGLIKILKNNQPNARIKGNVLCSLGSLLEQIASLLLGMRNVYANIKPQP